MFFKKCVVLILAAAAVTAVFSFAAESMVGEPVFITVDQFGYRPADTKVAVLRDPQLGYDSLQSYTPGTSISVVDSATGKVVYSGVAVVHNEGKIDTASGDKIWWFDFSKVSGDGTYFVRDDADTSRKSFYFRIREDVYNDILKAAVRMMFYQRVGFAKEARYAGAEWADAASHTQDAKARLFTDSTNTALERDVSGGWYDAGDYNKYTDWNGNYVEELLDAYFERPKAFTDDYDIPESGNGIPDVLDEVKWGLDHMLRLLNDDGSVISVVGESHEKADGSAATPPSTAAGRTYYGAPNATATYSAAKAFAYGAKAAKIFWGDEYAKTLETAAVKAFDWAESHQDSLFYNNDEAHGTKGLAAGQQEQNIDDNESTVCVRLHNRVNSALRLYELTGDAKYRKIFEDNYEKFPLMHGWGDSYRYDHHMTFLNYYSYPDADAAIKQKIADKIVTLMEKPADFAGAFPTDGYRAFVRDYNWGSNSAKASYGALFYRLAELKVPGIDAAAYKDMAEGYVHYMHGVNPFGMVYLSNMASYGAGKSATMIYHKWFDVTSEKWGIVKEGAIGPAPGYVPGGANSRYKWDSCCDQGETGCGSRSNHELCFSQEIPVGEPNEKMYRNLNRGWPIAGYQITEPSLGYQTKFIHMLSKFVEEKGGEGILGVPARDASPALPSPNVEMRLAGASLRIVSPAGVRDVRVYDLRNREVLHASPESNIAELDASSLRRGVYLVRVTTANGVSGGLVARR